MSSRRRIRTLLYKEWHELKRSRIMLGTAISMPVLLTAMGIGMLFMVPPEGTDSAPDPAELEVILGERAALFSSSADAMAVYLGEMSLMMMLLMPALVPSLLAANTIVREKQTRSLESLLVTPVRTWELVVAKLIFCLLAGVVPTYLASTAFYAVAAHQLSPFALSLLASPGWLITLGIVGPLLGILAVGLAIAISSRANDVQSAQQLAGMVCLPVIGLGVVNGAGLAAIGAANALSIAAVLALVDVIVVAMSISLFERETILTRWK